MTRHLLVIGAQRCGTTYLHSLLEAHPEIAMARPARPEPKVFCSDELAARGREWYVDTWFGHAGDARVLGEKSTSYIEDPRAPARAAAVLGDPLVLALLRDPVARAVSNWGFSTDNGLEQRPLVQALTESLDAEADWDPGATSVSPFAYLARGRYADHLGPWVEELGSDVHVGFLADLRAGGEAGDRALAALYAGLGVDPDVRPEGRERVVNASRESAPDLPADLVARLRGYFAPSDAALSTLLGRALPWRTDA